MQISHYIGQRLSFQRARCTVRFVGSIQGKAGEWLGVEWDDLSKGKHDGSLDGIQYFKCLSSSSTAASFIRPSRPTDPSLGLVDAISDKYATPSDDEHARNDSIRISGKTVEEVGFDKIQRQLAGLSELRIIVLDNLAIRGIVNTPLSFPSQGGLPSDIEKQLSWLRSARVEQLDLSCTLLEVWAEVLLVGLTAPKLRSLKLQGNRFRDTSSPLDLEPNVCLLELGLDDTLLPSDTIFYLIQKFPKIRTLSASKNGMTCTPKSIQADTLRSLDLSYNNISSFTNIRSLSSLPALTELSLRGNPIATLEADDIKFTILKKLDMTSTLLPSLFSLNPISAAFPVLQSLLTKNTPLSQQPSAHLLTIARVSTLTELNYSNITPAERQNAELYYISQITAQISAADSPKKEQEILSEHPRWNELCQIHGEVEVTRRYLQKDRFPPGSLGARTAKFTFELMPRNDIDERGLTRTKLIPLTTSIYRLTGIVASLFAIPYLSIKLILETDDLDPTKGHEALNDSDEDSNASDVDSDDGGKKDGWVRREEDLIGSMRPIADWLPIDFKGMGKDVRVRVEVKK